MYRVVVAQVTETFVQLCSGDHRGTWWLPHASDVSGQVQDMAQPVVAVSLHPESSALLQLASQQRMNTDIRRAIFCVLMSADDNVCSSSSSKSASAVERLALCSVPQASQCADGCC